MFFVSRYFAEEMLPDLVPDTETPTLLSVFERLRFVRQDYFVWQNLMRFQQFLEIVIVIAGCPAQSSGCIDFIAMGPKTIGSSSTGSAEKEK